MERKPRQVTLWYALWLIVFAVDASLVGRGWDHRVGALLFLLFFGFLIFTETRKTD